jgi:membrane-associated protein
MPMVKKNFKLVIVGIIIVSVLPAVIEVLREWYKSRTPAPAKAS